MKLYIILICCFLGASVFAQSSNDGSDSIREQLSSSIKSKGFITMAVVGFINIDGRQSELGRYFLNVYVERLKKDEKVRVVERERIDQLNVEWDLQHSGLIREDQITALGEMLGADVLVFGTLTRIGSSNRIAINVRLVDTKTGVIVSTASTVISGSQYRVMYNKILEIRE